jgi:hypothetical protein
VVELLEPVVPVVPVSPIVPVVLMAEDVSVVTLESSKSITLVLELASDDGEESLEKAPVVSAELNDASDETDAAERVASEEEDESDEDDASICAKAGRARPALIRRAADARIFFIEERGKRYGTPLVTGEHSGSFAA